MLASLPEVGGEALLSSPGRNMGWSFFSSPVFRSRSIPVRFWATSLMPSPKMIRDLIAKPCKAWQMGEKNALLVRVI